MLSRYADLSAIAGLPCLCLRHEKYRIFIRVQLSQMVILPEF